MTRKHDKFKRFLETKKTPFELDFNCPFDRFIHKTHLKSKCREVIFNNKSLNHSVFYIRLPTNSMLSKELIVQYIVAITIPKDRIGEIPTLRTKGIVAQSREFKFVIDDYTYHMEDMDDYLKDTDVNVYRADYKEYDEERDLSIFYFMITEKLPVEFLKSSKDLFIFNECKIYLLHDYMEENFYLKDEKVAKENYKTSIISSSLRGNIVSTRGIDEDSKETVLRFNSRKNFLN